MDLAQEACRNHQVGFVAQVSACKDADVIRILATLIAV